MTVFGWFVLGLVGSALALFFLAYFALFVQWSLEILKEPLARRILSAFLLSLASVIFLGCSVLSAIYFCRNGAEYFCQAGELHGFLLNSPWLQEFAYGLIILAVGFWIGIEGWRRSSGTCRSRFAYSVGEGLEGLFIGGVTIVPVLMLAYYALYKTLSWILDWGYTKLPI